MVNVVNVGDAGADVVIAVVVIAVVVIVARKKSKVADGHGGGKVAPTPEA